ncbi:hypothetical protein Y1Q_0014920 [Alligator mississippiensis]|uniref:PNPLA domain-containing protein n=1 Tax=Alligator mississippiensis TaxID=8496 RepID=A0A151N8H0_ALLMI|nr:hypothetical protein Y1Q_0014920 [Alligator mississippiensis]
MPEVTGEALGHWMKTRMPEEAVICNCFIPGLYGWILPSCGGVLKGIFRPNSGQQSVLRAGAYLLSTLLCLCYTLIQSCGFLMFYQMGVMKALQELAPEILRSASKIYGTSSGALIATLVTCGCEIDAVVGYMTDTVKNMEGSILRYLYPNNGVILNIQKALEKCLPDNAHQLASRRLHIFLTQVSGLQNVVVSEFSSKEEIIQAVSCSCFIPVYNGYIPPSFQGVRYIDGAFSSPKALFHKTMITVSGFAFDNDICPRDNPGTYLSVYMLQQLFQMSPENLKRMVYCFFPPSRLVVHEFILQGYHDAGFYLERNREFGIDYLARNATLPLASCGFLIVYELGVVKALWELAPEILRSATKIYGSSSGSIVASIVTCGCELDAVFEDCCTIVKEVRNVMLGPISPNVDLLLKLQKLLYKALPDNAHQLASGRLHVLLTRVSDRQSVVVSDFGSKEEVIQAVICSCFIPAYTGYIPPSFQGVVVHEFFLKGYHDAGFYLERNREFGIHFLANSVTLPLARLHQTPWSDEWGGEWKRGLNAAAAPMLGPSMPFLYPAK